MPHDDDDPSRLVFRGGLPDWFGAVEREGGLYRYVLLVIVSALLSFFGAVANVFNDTLYWLFVWPTRSVFNVLAGVSRPFFALLEVVESFQGTIEAAASSAGLAGPVVGLITWLVPALILIGIINVIIGIAETYLPLSAIPIIGRFL